MPSPWPRCQRMPTGATSEIDGNVTMQPQPDVTQTMIELLVDAVDDAVARDPSTAAWVVWGFGDALAGAKSRGPDRVDSRTGEEHANKEKAWRAGYEAV